MADELHQKTVRLSTGQSIDLGLASAYLNLLEGLAQGDEQERTALFRLRQVCLGDELTATDIPLLREGQLLLPDGTVDPQLRALVLAAVRGQGNALYLDSPFTDPWDRTVSDLFRVRDRVRFELGNERAAVLLNQSDFGGVYNTVDGIRRWAEHVRASKLGTSPPRPE